VFECDENTVWLYSIFFAKLCFGSMIGCGLSHKSVEDSFKGSWMKF